MAPPQSSHSSSGRQSPRPGTSSSSVNYGARPEVCYRVGGPLTSNPTTGIRPGMSPEELAAAYKPRPPVFTDGDDEDDSEDATKVSSESSSERTVVELKPEFITPLSPPNPVLSRPIIPTRNESIQKPASPTRASSPSKSPSKPRASAQVSRFQEGSMNDRTSSIPPLSFIGPENDTFERRLRLDYPGIPSQNTSDERSTSAMDTYPPRTETPDIPGGLSRPITAASTYLTGKRGFWGGLKEKLSFSRDRAGIGSDADSTKRPSSLDTPYTISNPTPVATPGMVPDPAATAADGKMPSREEVMANYKELMRNGFFDAHAIQSTRQPPPGRGPTTTSGTPTSSHSHTTGPSFASRMAAENPEPQHGKRPSTAHNRQWPLPTISSPGATSQNRPDSSRGTKRMHSSQEGDEADGEKQEGISFKKLRKSASRISADILRKQRSQPHVAQNAAHAADVAAMPPPPSITPFGINTRRTFSSSSRRETNRLAKRTYGNLRGVANANANAASSNSNTNVNANSTAAMAGDQYGPSRMSVDSTASSIASSSFSFESRNEGVAFSGTQQRSPSPTKGNTATVGDKDAEMTDAPALRVRPDVNRGIPQVPRIPEQFKGYPAVGEGEENRVPSPERARGRSLWAR